MAVVVHLVVLVVVAAVAAAAVAAAAAVVVAVAVAVFTSKADYGTISVLLVAAVVVAVVVLLAEQGKMGNQNMKHLVLPIGLPVPQVVQVVSLLLAQDKAAPVVPAVSAVPVAQAHPAQPVVARLYWLPKAYYILPVFPPLISPQPSRKPAKTALQVTQASSAVMEPRLLMGGHVETEDGMKQAMAARAALQVLVAKAAQAVKAAKAAQAAKAAMARPAWSS